MNLRFLLVLVMLMCPSTCLLAGEIYQWVDKEGVEHFSNKPPPPGIKATRITDEVHFTKQAQDRPTAAGRSNADQDFEHEGAQTDWSGLNQQDAPEGVQEETRPVQLDHPDEDLEADPYSRVRERVYRVDKWRKNREARRKALPHGEPAREPAR